MTTNVDYLPIYLSEISRQTANTTLLVQIVLGVVTLIFTLGAFLVWRENKAVIRTANDQLRMFEMKRAEIEEWHNEKKNSLDSYLQSEIDKFNVQVEEIRCYQTIIMGLENTGKHAGMIYSAVCFLSERPCRLYAAVFRELVRRNITNDITERAKIGLKKWEDIQKQKPQLTTADKAS